MPGFSNLKNTLSEIERLERELNLKQLQINRLLNITQSINNNVSAVGLFDMYKSFLSLEIGVRKMILYVKGEKQWICASSIGISEELLILDMSEDLQQFTRLKNVHDIEHPLIQKFDVVIPVRHKDQPIAYVFIGGFNAEEDMFNKIQFITAITNIIAVAIENKRLFNRQLEQERMKREMEFASDMQHMLIPKTLPSTSSYQMASIYKPHMGVGGDYFDYIEFGDGKIAFCIGDISGKGVAAALLMANFQANFHSLINKRTELDEFVQDLNHSVNHITGGEKFITFFIAEYDEKDRSLKYVNAGHNPPILASCDGISLLTKGCTILGSFDQLPEVEIGRVVLEREAMVLCYTDGLTDLKNDAKEFLSDNKLYDFVKSKYSLSVSAFNEKLMEEIEVFKGKQTYPDDFTILCCKFT